LGKIKDETTDRTTLDHSSFHSLNKGKVFMVKDDLRLEAKDCMCIITQAGNVFADGLIGTSRREGVKSVL
jgi:hypothetical protein